MLALVLMMLVDQAPPKPFTAGPSIEGFSEYRLPNGMRVVLVPDSSTPKVTVNLTLFVGSRHEGYGEKGMAHLLEHMLFKGTPTTKDPKGALIGRGANFNGTTNHDRTNYFEILPATDANVEFAIRFEADRMVNSFVAQKDLDTEMTVVRNEFEGTENNGDYVLYSRVRAAALPWHNYGRSVIGTRADIERVPLQNLQDFYRKYYQPDNALLVVAGKFDTAKVFSVIASSFGKIPAPKRRLPSTFTEEPVQDGERVVTVRRVGGSPGLNVAWRIPASSDPDFPALVVLQGVLGDAPQGRQHQALVDGKKAASVYCDLDILKEPGLFSCAATLRPTDDVEKAKGALLTVAEQLNKQPPTQAEVDRARIGWLSQWENAMNSSTEVGIGISNWAATGDWRMMFVQRDRLKAVTAQDVLAVANKYFKPQNRTLGEYVPTERPDRAAIALAPDVTSLVSALKGGVAVQQGEVFDPSPTNIDARTVRTTLSNGAKLVMVPKKTRASTVDVSMALHFGTLESLKGQQDVGDLTITMLGRGTKKLGYKDFRNKVESLKAATEIAPQPQTVAVDLQVKRPELLELLDLIADALTEPALDAAEFDVLKKAQLAGIEEAKTEPSVVGKIELQRALEPRSKDHPKYRATMAEEAQGVSAATIEQVRAFHAKFLGAQNAEIALVGDFDPNEVKAKLEARLGKWSAKEKYVLAPDAFVESKVVAQTIATPDKAQAWIGSGLAFRANRESASAPALMLANAIFGGSAAARLFNELREKQGLSYGAYSTMQIPDAIAGERSAFTGFAIYAPQNVAKVERALKSEIERLVSAGVKFDELEGQRRALLDRRAQSRATDHDLAAILIRNAQNDRTMSWEQQLDDKLKAVTPEQLSAAIKTAVDLSRLTVIKAGEFKSVAAPN